MVRPDAGARDFDWRRGVGRGRHQQASAGARWAAELAAAGERDGGREEDAGPAGGGAAGGVWRAPVWPHGHAYR